MAVKKPEVKRAAPKKDFEELLKSANFMFSKEDLKVIQEAYMQMKSSGKRKSKLLRPIVPIQEWIESSYYVGQEAYELYPYWKKHIINIFNSPTKINQVIFTGALGTGKSTAASLILIRKLYELSCYENVSSLFNLMGSSRIAFAYLSVSKEQAMNTGFSLIQEWIDNIPYFRENFPRKKGLDTALIWPQERLLLMAGSVANHFIGTNLIGSILDEANFFDSAGSGDAGNSINSKVSKLYTNIVNRAATRFISGGKQESLSVLVSSSQSSSSFTEQQINNSMNDPHTYIASPSQWDAQPNKFGKERFLVYVGGDGFDPHIIDTLEDLNTLLEARAHPLFQSNIPIVDAYKLLPPSLKEKILKVPEEFRGNFTRDVTSSLRDLAGYSSNLSSKFFQAYGEYNRVIKKDLKHPFTKEEIILSTTKYSSQDGYVPLKAYLPANFDFANKDKHRYVHLDLSKTGDSTGFSMGYISGWKTIYKEQISNELSDNEETHEIKLPIITMDFMLRINPPVKPAQISLAKIRDFFVFLRNQMGIKFKIITADQAFSAQLMQELEELDFPVGYTSVDRTSEAYDTLVDLIYEERIELYDYAPFKQELFDLLRIPDKHGNYKVDHPLKGSKDVADSIAGVAYNAIKSEDKTEQTVNALTNLFISANKNPQEAYKDKLKEITDELRGFKIKR